MVILMTKEEKREYYRQYRERNRDRINAYQRQYYGEHKEVIKLQHKISYVKRVKKGMIKSSKGIIPRKYYNREVCYAIKSENGEYLKKGLNWTFRIVDAWFFKDESSAMVQANKLNWHIKKHYVVQIEIKEKIGEQQTIGD